MKTKPPESFVCSGTAASTWNGLRQRGLLRGHPLEGVRDRPECFDKDARRLYWALSELHTVLQGLHLEQLLCFVRLGLSDLGIYSF